MQQTLKLRKSAAAEASEKSAAKLQPERRRSRSAPEVPAEEAAAARADKPGAKRKGTEQERSEEPGDKKKTHRKNKGKPAKRTG